LIADFSDQRHLQPPAVSLRRWPGRSQGRAAPPGRSRCVLPLSPGPRRTYSANSGSVWNSCWPKGFSSD